MQFHLRIGRESGWLARLAGALLAFGIVACIILLVFGLWLAFGVILLVGLAAAVLRALLWPRSGRTRAIEPPRD
ncbi:MAG TPA: hypothetical protein VII56_01645 [Rhizomicrobium sp.]